MKSLFEALNVKNDKKVKYCYDTKKKINIVIEAIDIEENGFVVFTCILKKIALDSNIISNI